MNREGLVKKLAEIKRRKERIQAMDIKTGWPYVDDSRAQRYRDEDADYDFRKEN